MPSRITPIARQMLAERAVSETNRTHDAAHAAGFPAIDATPPPLADAVRQWSESLAVHARPWSRSPNDRCSRRSSAHLE